MKKICKRWMVTLIISITLFPIGAAITSEQPFSTFVGKVVGVERGVISAEGGKGGIIQFAVGRNTVYIPQRLPLIGEWVKVEYRFDGRRNIGYQMRIIDPPSPKKNK
ncbi:MAG: hypothetical protein ACXU9W_13745 [Thermodesulfobacteriota bacterium]